MCMMTPEFDAVDQHIVHNFIFAFLNNGKTVLEVAVPFLFSLIILKFTKLLILVFDIMLAMLKYSATDVSTSEHRTCIWHYVIN